jgi:hypothetical protein
MVNTGHEGQVVCRKRFKLLNLLKRDQPGRGDGVHRIIVSRIILELLSKEVNNILLLTAKKRYVITQRYPVFVDVSSRLNDGKWKMGQPSQDCSCICQESLMPNRREMV